MDKLISIIIATYNVERVIERCLDTISQIKTDDIELVIVDGNSKDRSKEIITTKYKDLVDVFISEPDKGLYDAWNKGIPKSSGKWIMFLGADDRILVDNFNKYIDFVRTIDSETIDIISAQAHYVDGNGKLIKIVGEKYDWDTYKVYMNTSHGSTMNNRKLFDECGGFDINFRVCADYEFYMRKGANIKADFYELPVIEFVAGGASFSIQCQKDTFNIRKKYKTVSFIKNCYWYARRVLGMQIRKVIYKID